MHLFAMALRDELWRDGSRPFELRRGAGQALDDGATIVARDRIDDAALGRELSDAAGHELFRLQRVMRQLPPARMRAVVSARCIRRDDRDLRRLDSSLSLTVPYAGGVLSIVTDAEHAVSDAARLAEFAQPARWAAESIDPYDWPIVWHGGSGAVLLHEAAGHAAEHEHAPAPWPSWLRVRDELRADSGDDGLPATSADLLAGEPPRSRRRASFRDVALRRMSHLVATQDNAPWSMPDRRIDVHLVAGGAYEPLTESVSLVVAVADVVIAGESFRMPPFALTASRERFARALAGARGEPERYPGVVCSREGQELIVGSSAPLFVISELGH